MAGCTLAVSWVALAHEEGGPTDGWPPCAALLQSQEEAGFEGTFADFLQQRGAVSPDTLLIEAEELLPDEEVGAGGEALFRF